MTMNHSLDLRDLADELDALAEADTNCAPTMRYVALVALQKELGDTLRTIGEDYGPTLILESEFVEYAQELAEDGGMIPEGLGWPLTCIDWEHAARELRYDYTSVSFDGDDYLIRSW